MLRFEGIQLKLNRAQEHLQELATAIQALGTKPYEIVEQRDPRTRDRLFRLIGSPTPAFARIPIYPVMIGEFIHNLRSALDHAVWQLAKPPIKGRTGFPICIDESGHRFSFFGSVTADGLGVRLLENIPSDAFEYIERVQPYNRLWRLDELWVLNELWNEDKHRNLVVIAKPSWNQGIIISTRGGREPCEGEINPRSADDPDVVLVLDANSDSQVDFAPSPTRYVAFGKGPPAQGRPVITS